MAKRGEAVDSIIVVCTFDEGSGEDFLDHFGPTTRENAWRLRALWQKEIDLLDTGENIVTVGVETVGRLTSFDACDYAAPEEVNDKSLDTAHGNV